MTRINTRSSQIREANERAQTEYVFEEPNQTQIPKEVEEKFKNSGMTLGWLRIDLKEEGFNPTDDDYYTEVDNRLKEAFPHRYKTEEVEEVRKQETSPAQVVAGGTRSTPSSNKKVKLSKEDVRLANKWNIPLEQYAQEKLKANSAEGEYTTINMQRGGK